jgi:hypothetical protein
MKFSQRDDELDIKAVRHSLKANSARNTLALIAAARSRQAAFISTQIASAARRDELV